MCNRQLIASPQCWDNVSLWDQNLFCFRYVYRSCSVCNIALYVFVYADRYTSPGCNNTNNDHDNNNDDNSNDNTTTTPNNNDTNYTNDNNTNNNNSNNNNNINNNNQINNRFSSDFSLSAFSENVMWQNRVTCLQSPTVEGRIISFMILISLFKVRFFCDFINRFST